MVFKKYHRDLFYYMRLNNKVGGFNATTKEFYLLKDSTEIVVFHEQCHLAHWVEVGDDIYKGLSVVEKEMYVWKQIYKNKSLWTEAELLDALDYINGRRMQSGLPIIKIEQ